MIVVIERGPWLTFARRAGALAKTRLWHLAAWTLRFCPFVFCGSVQAAADFAFRILAAQVRDAERLAKAISLPAMSPPCHATEKPVAGPGANFRPENKTLLLTIAFAEN